MVFAQSFIIKGPSKKPFSDFLLYEMSANQNAAFDFFNFMVT